MKQSIGRRAAAALFAWQIDKRGIPLICVAANQNAVEHDSS
jgi:hypothetical protein